MTAHPAADFIIAQGSAEASALVRLTGDWSIRGIAAVDDALRRLPATLQGQDVTIDLSEMTRLDTSGALILSRTRHELSERQCRISLAGGEAGQLELLDAIHQLDATCGDDLLKPNPVLAVLSRIGDNVVRMGGEFLNVTGFAGLVLSGLARTIAQPKRFRLTSTVYHMEETGFNAIPIVSLISFLIGVVLAYQGATSLRTFGAEVFTVDLISVSILREIGILLTAIVVAGRSGSAFTAQIGAMKVNEEVDAMRTLGLDPIEILVLPRFIALLIMLPILGFIAGMMGLFGGMLMCWTVLDISPGMFVERFYQGTDIWHFYVGMIKAPFFAMIIALIGCYEGFRVSGSAASVGQLTTRAVVKSIFMVIIIDALFSIFFAEVGV